MRNKRKLKAATTQTARWSLSRLLVMRLGCRVRCPQRIAVCHGKPRSAEDSAHYSAYESNSSFTRARELRVSAHHRPQRFSEATPRGDKYRKLQCSGRAIQ